MQRLQMFTPYELKLLVCGEQTPTWTREDIVNFTEPKFGYTKDRLVAVNFELLTGLIELLRTLRVYTLSVSHSLGYDTTH